MSIVNPGASETNRPQPKIPDLHLLADLNELNQSVAWQYDTPGGKRTRVSYQPGRGCADTTNPCEPAGVNGCLVVRTAALHPFSVLGIVLSVDDPFTSIDVDGCRLAGRPKSWATSGQRSTQGIPSDVTTGTSRQAISPRRAQ
jgi:primase-polymerase (primpol)-like protein